jgi:hypothetical protein
MTAFGSATAIRCNWRIFGQLTAEAAQKANHPALRVDRTMSGLPQTQTPAPHFSRLELQHVVIVGAANNRRRFLTAP